MTVTSATIVNRALQLIGGFNNSGPITGTTPTFDGSAEGIAAGTVYDGVVQTVARRFGWDFSRNIATLVLSGNTAPLGFTYEYIYPSSGIQLRQLLPTTIVDANNPLPIRWTVGNALGPSTTAVGSIFFSAAQTPGQTITLNTRVFTFVASGATNSNYQINVTGQAGGTLALWLTNLYNGSPTYTADTKLNVATLTETGGSTTDSLVITYNTPGTAGNAYTLAASAAAPSGATLTGGSTTQQRVIWTNLVNALGVITNQPPESAWDAIFSEAVVRLLASELAQGLAGKPESSNAAFEQAAGFEQVGEQRVDS